MPSRAGTYTPSVRHPQFEGDALRNVQPVKFVVEDMCQTQVELLSTSDDSRGGVQSSDINRRVKIPRRCLRCT